MPKIQVNPYFFVSYSVEDREIVHRVIGDLRAAGIKVWFPELLHPGDIWLEAITSALEAAIGMIIFLSSASLRSAWVMYELRAFARGKDLPIIPILLEPVGKLPPEIMHIQYLDLTDPRGYQKFIERLILSLRQWERIKQPTATTELNVEEIATEIAQEAHNIREEVSESEFPPDSIFIVHGHDYEFLNEVKQFLISFGILPIVLSEEHSQHQTIFEKFWKYGTGVNFAIVLISSDDLGCALREYNDVYDGTEVRDKALKYRTRQNVILEMGFFYGRLGTGNIFVLMKEPPSYHPLFERPSDLDGVLFEIYDGEGKWKERLKKGLHEAGFLV